jgi:hypothetical protein
MSPLALLFHSDAARPPQASAIVAQKHLITTPESGSSRGTSGKCAELREPRGGRPALRPRAPPMFNEARSGTRSFELLLISKALLKHFDRLPAIQPAKDEQVSPKPIRKINTYSCRIPVVLVRTAVLSFSVSLS